MSTQMSASQFPSADKVDTNLEVITLPVSDIDGAKRFTRGWGGGSTPISAITAGEGYTSHARLTMLHPPWHDGGAWLGAGTVLVVETSTPHAPSSLSKGAPVSEPSHFDGILGPRLPGLDPERGSYGSYAEFKDPDGNGWLLQEVGRFPGRGLSLDVAL